MKKLYYVFVAASVVMATASCEKISGIIHGETTTEEGLVDDKGQDLTPDEQKVKIEETANTLMDLTDKKGWEEDYEEINTTIEDLNKKEVDSEEIEKYRSDIVKAWTTYKEGDSHEVAVTVAHLTDFKGHFTENAEGKFDFKEADDLAVTVYTGDVPVTVSFSAKKEASTPYHTVDSYEDVTVYIPATATLGIKKGKKDLGSLELRFKVKDVNGDGVITEDNDKVTLGYTLKVGDYSFELSDSSATIEEASASATLKKGKQLIIGVTVAATYEYKEEVQEDYTYTTFAPKSANAMVDLAGKTQIRFTVPDADKVQELANKLSQNAEGDGEQYKATLAELEKAYGFGVYYDGKHTLQATLGFEAVYYEEYSFWSSNPVVRFADGTSYAVEEYFTEERFGDLVKTINDWVTDLMKYLGLYYEGDVDQVK